MNTILEQINSSGQVFVEFALPMLVQSSVLIVILLLADFLLSKRVRAVFRYWMWMLVLVKLVLPSTLSSPVSVGYLFGGRLGEVNVSSMSTTREIIDVPQAQSSSEIRESEIIGTRGGTSIVPPIAVTELAAAEEAKPVSDSMAALSWQGIIFLVWFIVVACMLLLLLQRIIFVCGLVAQAKKASGMMGDALEFCRRRMGIRSQVCLKVSVNTSSPAVCGLFRPVILVPENLGESLGSNGLRTVLLHELAHIKRGDLWANLVQTILQIVYFYNPLAWLANAMIRRVREQAVDEAVQVAMGERACQYPETLLNVAKLAFGRPALSLRLIGVVESKSALTGRIKRMLNRPIPKSAKLGVVGLVAVFIIGAVLLPMAKAERFTGRAKEIMSLADKEARRLNHEYIGTEHILLAIARDDSSLGAVILKNLGLEIEVLRAEVEKLVKSGPSVVTKKRLPQTPRAIKVLKYAEEEAKELEHDYVGAEHILLGLAREREGIAAQVLTNLGLSYEDIHREVLKLVQSGAKIDVKKQGYRNTSEGAKTGSKNKVHVIKFGPKGSFKPRTAKELLDAFNKQVKFRVNTHHFRTAVEGNKLMGYILTDSRAEQKAIKLILDKSSKLEFIIAKSVMEDELAEHYAMGQQANKGGLQDLINSARSDGIVRIPNGVYTEPIEVTKSLKLVGESRDGCFFEVTANKPAILIDTKGKGRVSLENITVKWQLSTSGKDIEYPFAVGVKDSRAEIKNCSFVPLGNFKRCPSAIRAVGFSNLTIDSCRFDGFEYVICYGEGSEGTVQDSLIKDCGHQGIILYSDANAKILRNVVTGSRYHAVRSTGGTLELRDNLLINNANRGVYLGNKSARGTISNNIIMGNGTGISGFGQSKVKIENNLILDSSYAGIGMRSSCSLLIRNNIFQGNERGWIMFEEEGRGGNTVYKNTFWKNKVDDENFKKTADSIIAEPVFVDAANGDFSLKPGPVQENEQGLSNPEILKTLWKRWKEL